MIALLSLAHAIDATDAPEATEVLEPVALGPDTKEPFKSVIAYQIEGQDRVHIVASTGRDDCKTLATTPRSPRGKLVLDVVLTAAPHGEESRWTAGDVRVGAFSPQWNEPAVATVERVDVTEGALTALHLTATLEHDPDPPYTLDADLVAEGCGILPADPGPAARPQPAGTLTYAGRVVPVLGAVLEQMDKPHLLLSTHPLSCEDKSDADLLLYLQTDGLWNQGSGNWTGGMSHASTFTFQNAEGRTVTLGTPAEGRVPVEVQWTSKIPAAAFTVTGSFDALDCRPVPSSGPAMSDKTPQIDAHLLAWLDEHAGSDSFQVPMEIEHGVLGTRSAIVYRETRIEIALDTTALSMTLGDHLSSHCKRASPCRVWVEGTWGPLMGEAIGPVLTVRRIVGPATGEDAAIRLL